MKIRLKRLDRQTMVIMGATSGIGLTLARKASRAGASVFLIARDLAVLDRLANEINGAGGHAAYAVADVGDQEEVRAAAWSAVARFGGFDTWVNTAGVALYAPLLQTTAADHERLFRTNYWGVVHGCLAAAPHLRSGGGALITVGSVVCDIGTPILGAYAASKHAVKGYVDSLRIELLAEHVPIAVTLIKPSGVGTPLAEHAANYYSNAPRIPPPAYAPDLVASAILHAAEHSRREITVGGAGALQILGNRLFPHLSDRIASKIGPLMTDSKRASRSMDNLASPQGNGLERSEFEPIRAHSVYTHAVLHPSRTLAWGLGIAVIGMALAGNRLKFRRA